MTGFGWPLAVVVLLELLAFRFLKPLTGRVAAAIEQPEEELAVLAKVLARLEREQMNAPLLVQLKEALKTDAIAASVSIAGLQRRLAWLAAQRNQLFAPIAFLTLWEAHFALAIERWRRRHGKSVRRWLTAVGELEALGDLATYSFEHPDDPFPAIEDGSGLYVADALGHPLIPESRCVRNDVQLGESVRLLVVSGSNMSGKSTLLRSVGVSAVMGLCGGPVRAKSLRLSRLVPGATLRIHDSIHTGTSRFFSEVKRLRELMEKTEGGASRLILLDEIFHGTNSHDRRAGAAGVLRAFLDAGAIGLVTTHDLALTDIVGTLDGRARNVHFEDQFDEGELRFDYTLRDGVVTRSNALALMRSVGLDV